MPKSKRAPQDFMDDIYNLAYWMTGSETKTKELVNRTYLTLDRNSSETEVFKIFRSCYFDGIDQEAFSIPETAVRNGNNRREPLRKRFADIKLSVLLSEIPGLKPSDISKIIGKPLETIKIWLSTCRKTTVNETLLNASF
jgi:DNA-directed RNA polymerase specialized sigma24 family protein